ncbi:MAG: hypothetical protein LWW76_05050 [Burkholderiales bacterium]|jgi:hypothetical protein|nr:hypothetical protein [Burkholderiales bacterium]
MTDFTLSIDALMNEAHTQADRLSISGLAHNDSVDAFRHAYASARMTDMYGIDVARKAGIKHEQDNLSDAHMVLRYPNNYPNEKIDIEQIKREIVMDLYNNQVGRRYGEENPDANQNALSDVIYEKGIKGGELIQNLQDPRIEHHKDYYLKQLDQSWLLSESQQNPLNQPIAVNASNAEVKDYLFAALMSDDDDLRYAAIDSVLQTNVAQDFAEQAQQVAQAYDQQQAQIQQMNNPVRVMKIG